MQTHQTPVAFQIDYPLSAKIWSYQGLAYPSSGREVVMGVSATEIRPEELAKNLCDLITHLCLAAPRGRRRSGDLKEVEFLTLSILFKQRTLIVGNIQRMLGVLPAQMSRVIRSLEDRERPLISCRINPRDKRKIDVSLTAAGVRAFHEHQAARVAAMTRILTRLPEEDLDDLLRLSEKLRDAIDMPNA